MKYFDQVLKAKFNVLPSNNKKSVTDKYPTNMLDLDFEGEVLKVNSDLFIVNVMVFQEYNYYYGEHDETNTCIDIKLSIK